MKLPIKYFFYDKINSSFLLVLFFIFFSCNRSIAQCGPMINIYPYSEGFENAPAWTSGGTNSDWAWGSPVHPTISSAGGGAKCWCVGGLSGSFYNYSEQSWLMSPCFDFSTLTYPWISFKIFWEDEWKYDGMVLQSSLDGGITWTNVGAYGDPVDCLNANWYNYNNITWLTTANPKEGWCGRTGPTSGNCQGGNGSLGWITAKHCLSSLANQPSVRFRFLFGSGTTCNSYDGIAVDDILVQDAPPNVANFTYVCNGNSISFTNLSTPCPTAFSWNFGDPNSGPSNISTLQNPSHIFSGAGTYTVSLTSSGPCNAPGTFSVPISILSANIISTNVLCSGNNNGSATVNVIGGSGPFLYSWSTIPIQTSQTATGLSAGNYMVTVTAPNSCPVTQNITIAQPQILTAAITSLNSICNQANGSATVIANGGTGPYSYSWNTIPVQTASTASALSPGNYSVVITDNNGCTTSSGVTISTGNSIIATFTNVNVSCFNGNNGSSTVIPSGGNSPYSFSWSTIPVQTSATATGLNAGNYSVVVTDNNGCSMTAIITITQAPLLTVNIPNSNLTICSGQSISINAIANGGSPGYQYSWMPGNLNGSTVSITPSSNTIYTVVVTDANNCSVNASVTINVNPLPAVNFSSSDSSGCAPLCLNFVNNSTGSVNCFWNFGDGNNSTNCNVSNYCYANPGSYTVQLTVTDANGCANSASVPNMINVFANPVACFTSSPSQITLIDPTVNFTDCSSSNIVSWNWVFGDLNHSGSTVQDPSFIYSDTGTFQTTLIVTNANGCTASVQEPISVHPDFELYVPNAFTPNGSGLNDYFGPKGVGIESNNFRMLIFDRWGNKIFESHDINKLWDGRANGGTEIAQEDVYVWLIYVNDNSSREHKYTGHVTLIK